MRPQPGNVTPTIMNHGFCFGAQLSASGAPERRRCGERLKHLRQLLFHPDVSLFSCVASSGESTDQVTPGGETTVAAEGQKDDMAKPPAPTEGDPGRRSDDGAPERAGIFPEAAARTGDKAHKPLTPTPNQSHSSVLRAR